MELNLRKAAHVEKAIRGRVAELAAQLETRVEVTIYSDAVARRDDARRELKARQTKINDLQRIRYGIRARLAEANSSTGVAAMVAELNHQRERVEILGRLAKAKSSVADGELMAEMAGRKSRFEKGDGHYDREKVSVELLTEEDVRAINAELAATKRVMVDINDHILAANVASQLTLSPEDAAVLTAEGFL